MSATPADSKVVQPSETVPTANHQVKTAVNPEEVANSLRNQGVSSKKADGIADAVTARLNGQELTRKQRSILRSALSSSAVRNTISDIINSRKPTAGLQSVGASIGKQETNIPDGKLGSTEQSQKSQTSKRRNYEFTETVILPEQNERLEKVGFTWERDETTGKTAVKKVRMQNEMLANQPNTDTINLGEMYSKAHDTREKFKFISDERFAALTIEARKKRAVIIRGTPEVEYHLDIQGASAAALGDVLMFRKDVCLSEVLEETHHFNQNLIGLNNDKKEPLRTILNEIDAKEYIISVAQKYQIPRNELEHLKKQLESYRKHLRNYKKGG